MIAQKHDVSQSVRSCGLTYTFEGQVLWVATMEGQVLWVVMYGLIGPRGCR
jgi:hypothetical protein